MSVAYPGLNIDAKGKAIKILEGTQPATFGASTNNALLNGGLTGDGGFSDLITQSSIQPHLYTFTFAPGTTVSSFSVRMLDFGDLDPTLSTAHYAKMTAFNASGVEIGRQELNYNTTSPYFSPVYGSLFVAGDAINAQPGQPGKWTWKVNGSGITKVVLEFGAGFDPNIGFDTLSFCQ